MTALPTRKSESWRYADLKAVEALWPPPPARLIPVPAGQSREEIVRITEGGLRTRGVGHGLHHVAGLHRLVDLVLSLEQFCIWS